MLGGNYFDKKRYLFFLLIICLFTISTVSAEEIVNGPNIVLNNHDSSLVTESVNEEYVGSADNGTFTDLQKKLIMLMRIQQSYWKMIIHMMMDFQLMEY